MTRGKRKLRSPSKSPKAKQDLRRSKRTCRRSTRSATPTSEPEATVDSSVPKETTDERWTKEDKKILLDGLRKHGHRNVPAIAEMLPHLPPEDVRSKILKYSVLSEYLYEDALLNDWMKCGLYKEEDSPVEEALLFVGLFERHPSVADARGYNFREIYKFLRACCSESSGCPDLSQRSQGLLYAALSRVDRRVWPSCQKDLWEYLGRVYNRRHISKVYPGKRASSL